MLNDTRLRFNAFVERIGTLNGVADATKQFVVSPSMQQKIETKIQESDEFLKTINIVPVPEMTGSLLGLGLTGIIASRTNTLTTDRLGTDPTTLDERIFTLLQTNFDWTRRYAAIDMWAKFPDFETRIRDAVIRQCALDRIAIGFRGTSAAATTDKTANPLGQDVNKGWLQHLREDAPARVLSDGPSTGANAVKVGTGAGNDYRSLDQMVFDVVTTLLDPVYREDPDNVAYVGRQLLHDKYFGLMGMAVNDPASEKLALDVLLSEKKLGGLPVRVAPFMIPNGVFVTSPKNLSIYYQDGKRRRQVIDNPKRDRIENFESSNEAYVIEELGGAALVENIVLS